MWPVITGGFLLGTLGSAHCVGMCGPLALSLPIYNQPPLTRFFNLFGYQLGRVFTYSILGLILGLAGRQLHLAGLQQAFSIVVGVLILLGLLIYFSKNTRLQLPLIHRFHQKVQQYIITLLKRPQNSSTFILLGLANGLLPCGMVYIAIAGAANSSSLPNSVLFMASFGAGTIPAMMLIGYFGMLIKPGVRKQLQQVIPVTMALMGILLVLRGLNLGIPYISPILPAARGEAIICH